MARPTVVTNEYRVISRPVGDLLGEGLMWSARRGVLFWVDILAPALHSYDLGTGRISTWTMPEKVGWVLERAGRDDFVIGLKSGVATLALEPFSIQKIGSPEPHRPHNRLNDAKVDRNGRIWAGTMDDREEEVLGALHRLDPDFTWSAHDHGYGVTNGPTFSVDGRTLFHTDSMTRTVYAFDLSAEGNLTNKRVFLQFEETWGYPDGMCSDAEGCLWIAHWGGGRVSRFDDRGELLMSVALPATQITNCVFAGAQMDRMFVTSASVGLRDEPLAGSLFEINPGTQGLASAQFAG